MTAPTLPEVEKWIVSVESEIAAIDADIEPRLAKRNALDERLTILQRLRASLAPTPSPVAPSPVALMQAPAATPSSGTVSVRDRVHGQALGILREAGKPMHINNLHAEFKRRGYEIPGSGRPNNITAHLTGWKDIDSPSRGFYKAHG